MSKREIPEVTPCDDAETALDKLRGNWTVDSVEGAMVALSNEHRGLVTLGLFHEGAPPEILRAALETVWQLDYSELWKACRGSIPMVTKIFRAAEFDIDHLPEVSDIWRGGVGRPRNDWRDVASGISWTRNREVACWFAFRPSGSWIKGEPVVLKRTIERRDVLAHFTGRHEDEIVTTTPRPSEVDGSLEDWRAAADRRQNTVMAEQKARLKAIARRRRLQQAP
jgi:hypothetical protein